ncbi:substrate-binding domain-containing protein [Nocardiopsis alba]|uniref:Substrate-binding domain-containing protein n=1 Tax=Nocardiopsis alba TaxID=53437 RepID=A0A7K2IN31_9ACTN|nr:MULTISPECIES: substrate-binding domain-containing protein [Nocardiopsis]MEC3895460.1 substrate-binding domain-containing protein [Nocardiopsis sp. LDBS1602]MYR31373.1 substrate-binding domain-containing protein [Nocardiopsis alba]
MATDTAKSGGARSVVGRFLLENGALTALAVLVVVMSLLSGDFLTAQNLLNVGVQAAVIAVLAFGVTFVIISGGIDLSVGSVAALSATALAFLAAIDGVPIWLAVVLAAATGTACGLVNGALIAYGKLPPFIATLAMLSIGRGLSLVISEGSPIALPDPVARLGDSLGGWFPVPVLIMLLMGLVTAVILRRTFTGRAMYAIGGNEEAARLSGIRVERQKLGIYALSGLFAAVAGVILAARLASAQPQAAQGYELDAIAAVVIGGASLAGGVGTALGTLIGALILAVLRNGLNLLSVSAFWQQVVIGVVIALAVLFDTLRRRSGGAGGGPGAGGPGVGGGRRGVRLALAAAVTALVVGALSFLVPNSSSDGPRVGMSLSTLNNPFFLQMRDGAQEEADEAGVNLIVTDAQDDASQQADQIQNFISTGVDAMVLNPVDSDASGPPVRGANNADIPVIAADRGVEGAEVETLVASDNVEGGREAARVMADALGEEGRIVVLQGTPGTSASRERGSGFAEGIAEFPDIEVVSQQPADFDRSRGLDVMTNMLQSNGDVDGVFAENDEMALGAAAALSSAGKEAVVIGFDGTPEGVDAVGEGVLYATIAQRPAELGRAAVRNAIAVIEGERIEETVKVPVEVVTEDNVDDFS